MTRSTKPLTVQIRLPRPHDKQRDFLDSPAKRRVIVAGRRGGKTTGNAIHAVKSFLAGKRVLYAAPTEDQTSAFWEHAKRIMAPLIDAAAIRKTESPKVIEWADAYRNGGGARIRAKTAWNADTLRGDYADELILDEFSLMSPDSWEEVGQPMLLDNDGSATFIFTPKRRNHAYHLYAKARASDKWGVFRFTSHDNPHLSKRALEEMAAEMTEDAYRQEILAEFLESGGTVFRNVRDCIRVGDDQSIPRSDVGTGDDDGESEGRWVGGLDLARLQDWTVLTIGRLGSPGLWVGEPLRFNQLSWGYQVERIKHELEKYGNPPVLTDATGVGDPVLEQLRRAGVNAIGFKFTAESKTRLIENLAISFEKRALSIPNYKPLIDELETFEFTTGATGNVRYNAPEGMHDDCVISLALCAWQARPGAQWQTLRAH